MLIRPSTCCWVVASRKYLADEMAALSLSTCSPILVDKPSDNLLAIKDKISLSDNSRRMCATDLIATFALGGSLKEREAENNMTASLLVLMSSLFRSHTFFSSHAHESFAEDTGLGEAAIWASKSDQGAKS